MLSSSENLLGRLFNKLFPWESKGLLLFFLTVPLAYVVQVISGVPELAVIPYLGLLYALILFAYREFVGESSARDFFVSVSLPTNLILLVVGHNLITSLYFCVTGDFELGMRALILFTLPWGLYFIAFRASHILLEKILIIISVISVVVGIEAFYENINSHLLHRVTLFQEENLSYVYSRIGQHLSQLATPGYRAPGLMEHVHALTTFLAIGSYASLTLYVWRARAIWLIVGVLLSFFLLSHGVRLTSFVFLLTIFTIPTLVVFTTKATSIKRNVVHVQVGIVFVIFVQLVLDPVGTSAKYYYPAIFDGNFHFNTTADTSSHVKSVITYLAKSSSLAQVSDGEFSYLFNFLFGYGVVGSLKGFSGFNDDVFIFALLEQYGIIVFLCFYILMVYSIVRGGVKILVTECREKIVLGVFAVLVLVTLIASTLHSSVIQRKAIFPFLPLTIGVIARNVTKK